MFIHPSSNVIDARPMWIRSRHLCWLVDYLVYVKRYEGYVAYQCVVRAATENDAVNRVRQKHGRDVHVESLREIPLYDYD